MYKILDNLAVDVFTGSQKSNKLEMNYIDAKFGYIDDCKIIDVRMLNKSCSSKDDYDLNISRVTSELDLGKKVVICCDAGHTKNIEIAKGVLIKYFSMDTHDAWKLIKRKFRSHLLILQILNIEVPYIIKLCSYSNRV